MQLLFPMDSCWCCAECLSGLDHSALDGSQLTNQPPDQVPETIGSLEDPGLGVHHLSHSTNGHSIPSHEVDMCLNCEKIEREDVGAQPVYVVSFSPSRSPRLPVPIQIETLKPNSQEQHSTNGVIPVDTNQDEVRTLYIDAFLHNNRLEHVIQIMGYHPRYLECFLKTQQYILRGDGPLPYDYRHYIAIMASGRHQSSYLVNIQKHEFLLQGGDERWLQGIEYIPQKLKDLYELNKILAHRPWLINKSHIEKLTRGNDNWSLSEMMHAFVLMAHFHALSSFVYGSGINAEVDCEGGYTTVNQAHNNDCNSLDEHSSNSHSCSPSSASDVDGGIEKLMERMKRIQEDDPGELTQEQRLKAFEKVESQSAELKPASSAQPSPKGDVLKFVKDADFVYQDFAKRGTEIPTFRAQDYSWEEQGYSLANRLYNDIGTYLEDKFQITQYLTYNTMGDRTDIDTTSFRRAIWNYIHCMFGIRHDDYDYGEVNQLLERNLKSYIKTVTCYPERVTRKEYKSFMREFKDSEKVHVNLMLLEARLQAELLYGLRAIMKYMT